MSFKTTSIIKLLLLIILGILGYLMYILQSNQHVMIALGIMAFLDIIALLLQHKESKKHKMLNSLYDKETKLYNRQYFLAELSTTYERSIRYDSPLSILLITITNFFDISKEDQEIVLKEIGTYMLTRTRESDTVSRYDENRIIMLLPMTDYLHASIAKDRIQNDLARIQFNTKQKPIFNYQITQNSSDEDAKEFLVRTIGGCDLTV